MLGLPDLLPVLFKGTCPISASTSYGAPESQSVRSKVHAESLPGLPESLPVFPIMIAESLPGLSESLPKFPRLKTMLGMSSDPKHI